MVVMKEGILSMIFCHYWANIRLPHYHRMSVISVAQESLGTFAGFGQYVDQFVFPKYPHLKFMGGSLWKLRPQIWFDFDGTLNTFVVHFTIKCNGAPVQIFTIHCNFCTGAPSSVRFASIWLSKIDSAVQVQATLSYQLWPRSVRFVEKAANLVNSKSQ